MPNTDWAPTIGSIASTLRKSVQDFDTRGHSGHIDCVWEHAREAWESVTKASAKLGLARLFAWISVWERPGDRQGARRNLWSWSPINSTYYSKTISEWWNNEAYRKVIQVAPEDGENKPLFCEVHLDGTDVAEDLPLWRRESFRIGDNEKAFLDKQENFLDKLGAYRPVGSDGDAAKHVRYRIFAIGSVGQHWEKVGGFLYAPVEDRQKLFSQRNVLGVHYGFLKTDMPTPEDLTSLVLLPQWFFTEVLATYVKAQRDRAARIAIMARNMSHNLGSHVLSRVDRIDAVWRLADPKSLDTLTGKLNSKKVVTMPHDTVALMCDLLSYLRERMDFIAEIVTSAPSWEMPMMLAELRDYLKPMLPTDNAGNGRTYSGQHLLLFGLGASDKPNWTIDFDVESDLLQDYVSIPGDVEGKQAFASIVENLIRNAVKHTRGATHPSSKLVLTLTSCKTNHTREPIGERELLWMDLRDNIPQNKATPKNLVRDLNAALRKPPVEPGGTMTGEGRGMKELSACCGYLLGQDLGNLSPVPPCEYHIAKENGKSYLAFCFPLLKPATALIVSPQHAPKKDVVVAKRLGILFEKALAGESFPQLFEIRTGAGTSTEPSRRPSRIVKMTSGDVRGLLQKEGVEEVLVTLYEEWLPAFVQKKCLGAGKITLAYGGERVPCKKAVQVNSSSNNRNGIQVWYSQVGNKPQADKNTILLFHHAKNPPEKLSPKVFQNLSGAYPQTKLLEQIECAKTPKQKLLVYRFVEAYLTKVVIFDERLGERDLHAIYGNWRSSRSIDPSLVEDDTDFVVIHYGLMEKSPEKWKHCEKQLRRKGAEPVIISGRGVPDSVSKTSRFLSYSVVAGYTVNVPSPFHLSLALRSARSPIRK